MTQKNSSAHGTRDIDETPSSLRLDFWVQPKASKTKLSGLHGDCLKLTVAAPPIEGKANCELIRFLSDKLSIPKSSVEITSGKSSRRKSLLIRGVGQKLFQKIFPLSKDYF